MKNPKRNEIIVPAVCQKTGKPFGITALIEKDAITFKWAFKMSDSTAKREGFDKNKVSGNIYDGPEFPGCPHCGNDTWYICGGCKRFVCVHHTADWGKCPVCGKEGGFTFADSFEIAGTDL